MSTSMSPYYPNNMAKMTRYRISTLCIDITRKCKIWTRRKLRNLRQNHPANSNQKFTLEGICRCDFCTTYKPYGPGEIAIQECDNCLDPATMCNYCRKTFNVYTEYVPEEVLLAKSGTYPVILFRRFTAWTKNGKNVETETEDISQTILAHLNKHLHPENSVRVFAVAVTPPGETSCSGASVLVDFPHYVSVDIQLLETIFGAIVDRSGSQRWAFRVPRREQCLSEFRLTWWKSMWDLQRERWRVVGA